MYGKGNIMSQRSKNRNAELGKHGVGMAPIVNTKPKSGSKSQYLAAHRAKTQTLSPLSSYASVDRKGLLSKVDAPNAGDHSPSIKTVNTTKDHAVGISGRGSYSGQYKQTIGERDVPTLQFTTTDFNDPSSGKRDGNKGSSAHTLFTSLRQSAGVGEVHRHQQLSDVLDHTLTAYSPYSPSTGEPESGGVSAYRVNVFSENKSGASLHRSKRGVSPLVAQAMTNIWYRSSLKFPDKLSGGGRNLKDDHSKMDTSLDSPSPSKISHIPTSSIAMPDMQRSSRKRSREEAGLADIVDNRPRKKRRIIRAKRRLSSLNRQHY